MPLRPRYSLLTLLVLTALVAGGVKLWYGPHHVQCASEDSTYTRIWLGKQIFHGPRVLRGMNPQGVAQTHIGFYRNGALVSWSVCTLDLLIRQNSNELDFPQGLELTAAEYQDHKQAIEREIKKLADRGIPGLRISWASGWDYTD